MASGVMLHPDPLEQLAPDAATPPEAYGQPEPGPGTCPVRGTSSKGRRQRSAGPARGSWGRPLFQALRAPCGRPSCLSLPGRGRGWDVSGDNVGVGLGSTGLAFAGSGSACETVTDATPLEGGLVNTKTPEESSREITNNPTTFSDSRNMAASADSASLLHDRLNQPFGPLAGGEPDGSGGRRIGPCLPRHAGGRGERCRQAKPSHDHRPDASSGQPRP